MTSCKFQAFHICCLLLYWVWSSLVDPCWEIYHTLKIKITYTPHTHVAPTLGVHTNMLPFRSTKNSSPTLWVYKKCLLGKYSMFWRDNDLSLNMWFRRRDMGYAKGEKQVYGHMKVQVQKRRKIMSTWRLMYWKKERRKIVVFQNNKL